MSNNPFARSGIGSPAPVTEQVREDMVPNTDGGGFVFKVDHKTRLTRFLVLGTSGGTYYATEKKLTKDNAKFLTELIAVDQQMVLETVLEISTSGRAYRNSPAIFACAALAVYGKVVDLSALVKAVCRTSTHLFEFVEYVKMLGGFGRAKRAAIASWYTDKTPQQLAYQVIKYRQRNGWTHRDMLRLSHPVGLDQRIGDFILGKNVHEASSYYENMHDDLIRGFKFAQESKTASELINVALMPYPNLPWEAIPTEFLKELRVWKQLIENGQLTGQALLRNITRLARLEAFNNMVFERDYANRLVDVDMMRRTRLHPFQYLLALTVHQEGQADRRGSNDRNRDWTPSPVIVDALNDGFYKAFKYVEPANKRTMLALDVSASMSWNMAGIDLTAAQVVAAMSMTVARTEPYYHIVGFADQIRDLGITPGQNLNEVMQRVQSKNFGYTNISAAIEYARQRKIAMDTLVIMTDNEVNSGVHPYQALQRYRREMNIPTKLIVVATTPTNFSIADPNDSGMLDISGADSNLPALIANFSAGRI